MIKYRTLLNNSRLYSLYLRNYRREQLIIFTRNSILGALGINMSEVDVMRGKFPHRDALWALVTQALIVIICIPIIWYFWQIQAAGSLLVGGLVCLLPNIYMYRRAFAHFGARQAKQILKDMFWGEAVKLVLTAVCFCGALVLPWVIPVWLFIGFILAQVGFWLAPIYLGVRNKLVK